MILTDNSFRGKATYVVELTLKSPHNAVKGDEVRNVAGELFYVTGETPGKITIIGGSMDHLLEMTGLWRIGNHVKFEDK